ncbi:peptidase [Acidovorax sp. HDW3]|uniref:PepSY domain-containing protein n=1 Tax=Acidovorax sp. HDW3 TaxID=2714923 RepID=UPI001409DA5D|nr:PepSY domain-containing protein [Acidovorax sp. HDW3]QIL45356.1 peptidase [Acidovorax sp. HDW3]
MTAPHPPRRTALALLASVFTLPAWADHGARHDHERARQALQQGRVLPLRQVLDGVERDYGGQVLKIEFESDDDRFVYDIRLLQNDGQLVKLRVDAVDGKVLHIRRKPNRAERKDDAYPGGGR